MREVKNKAMNAGTSANNIKKGQPSVNHGNGVSGKEKLRRSGLSIMGSLISLLGGFAMVLLGAVIN